MASMTYFIKPYEIQQAIDLLSSQDTLDDLKTAIENDVAAELGFQCPKCVGTGRINAGASECDYCFGWGAVDAEPTVVRQFTPDQVQPILPTT